MGFPFHGHAPPTCTAFRIRHLGSGIALSPGFPFRASISVYPTTAFSQPGANGASQVLQRISSYMPQPEDSGGHPHPHHDGCFILASVYVKTLAIRNSHFEAVPAFRVRGYPYGLQDSLCTPHPLCSAVCYLWLRCRCNTRYGWVAGPYPTGTSPRQDAPSLSWRDNARAISRSSGESIGVCWLEGSTIDLLEQGRPRWPPGG